MRIKGSIFLLVASCFAAYATDLPVTGGWQADFGLGGGPTINSPWTFTTPEVTLVSVTDVDCKGDQFRISDNGVVIGTTSLVAVGACPGPNDTANPDVAFVDATYSHGSFVLAPGSHSISIEHLVAPFGPTQLFIRADFGPAAQLTYAANLQSGDSKIDLTNAGTMGGNDATDHICANVYVFAEDQQLIECCTCPLTPNHLRTLSVNNDLINNTLTPGVPIGVTVAVVATTNFPCDAASPVVAPLGGFAGGLRGWGTKLHAAPGGGFSVTETPLSLTPIGPSELNKMTSYCGFIKANGSHFGICNTCQDGAQGASRE